MTSWPSHTDYQDAIQNPHICFDEEALKGSEVKCDMLGLPRVMSGNFASVYSVTGSDGRWAIRCFVRQVLGQQGRYARLSQHLYGLDLACMVPFEYFLRGIKVRNEWYPVVKMRWVDGLPLNQFVEESVNDAETLRGLAAKLRVMMRSLREHQLAHGDLQHGNIMITPDAEIRLVDYDGMYTPAFRGKSPELGHANFQHPRRTPDYYNEDLDNFGALIIYTSLLAVAGEPEVFQKFYTGDNLLLLSADYRNPLQSETIKRLKEHKDPQVKQLAELIERCCLVDVSQVPNFEDTIAALEKGSLAAVMPVIGAAPVQPAAAAPIEDWLSKMEGSQAGQRAAGAAAKSGAPSMSRPGTSSVSKPGTGTYKPPAPQRPPAPMRPPAPTMQPVYTPPAEDNSGASWKLWAGLGAGAVGVFLLFYLLSKIM